MGLHASLLGHQIGHETAVTKRLRITRSFLVLLAADAVVVEPVSAPKFPANREINREFFDFGLARGSEVAICPMIHWTWSKISYSTEKGIFVKEQGIFTRE